jgi:transcriptional regulator with XRE-family HTH domain
VIARAEEGPAVSALDLALRKKIAKALDARRMRRGWTLHDLAREMRTSTTQVQRLLKPEQGSSPTLRSVCVAACALGLSVEIKLPPKWRRA